MAVNTLQIIVITSLSLLFYTYCGYPLLLWLLARSRKSKLELTPRDTLPAITVVIAAFNEARRIQSRIRDILAQDYPSDLMQILVVDDGSEDGTAEAARNPDPRVRVIRQATNGGKAVAINTALSTVTTPVTILCDARQRFVPGTLRALVTPLHEPAVGSVSGRLLLETEGIPAAEGVGLYWAIESSIRRHESDLGWLHGVSGAVHALRTSLFRPMPPRLILDDMWIPIQVIFAGKKVHIAADAVAIDQASETNGEEYARKIRTLAGNWQLLQHLPRLASPLHNPVFFAWLSHKMMRLLAPWLMLLALLGCALSPTPWMKALFWLQLLAYAIATGALLVPHVFGRIPLARTAGTFLMLNTAALLSLPAAIRRSPGTLWKSH